MLLVAIDVELLRTASGLVGHKLVGQVDLHFCLGILFDAVEELSQKVLAEKSGCNYMQGFYYSGAKRADRFIEYVRDFNS